MCSNIFTMKNKRTLLLSLLFISFLYLTLTSSSGGINNQSVAGCTCHGLASANTLVTITGLPAGGYTNGTVYPITVSVTNTIIVGAAPNGLRDGFDMTSTSGSFTAVAGTALNGATEIRHNTPKAPVAGTATWTFNWTAPASGNANVSFFVSGNATNGDGTNGNGNGTDQWNQTSATIYKSGAILAVTATAPTITCNGGVSTITATGSGPTLPYQYSRNGGAFQSGNTFTNNLAGTYTITVRDATLATATTLLTINQPTLIVPGATATPINCNGGTATITASATGGTGAFMYRLNTGAFQTSPTFNNNLAATYTVMARDASLCTKTTVLVISQPTAMNFTTPILTTPQCNGGTGAATVSVTGGTGSKTYTISPLGPQSNTTGNFTGLTAQLYTVTATDASNCTKTTVINITQPTLLNFTTPIITNPLCHGGTGSASVTATGGTGTKTYTITPLGPQSNTLGNFTGLTAQLYTMTVSDANNCTKTTVINITQPNVLSFTAPAISNPLCHGGSGIANLNAVGGTGIKTYTIDPLGPQSNTTGNFSGLTAQTYTVIATDVNGCASNTSITVLQPAPITVTASDVSGCIGDTMLLQGNPAGGLFNVSNPYNGPTTQYTYTYTDGNGCSNSATANIFMNSIALGSISALPPAACLGGNTYVSVTPADLNCIPLNSYNGCVGCEFISQVVFDSIDNASGASPTGYTDYSTTKTTTVNAGNSYLITVSDGAWYLGDAWTVWIDYNHNGYYGDAGEMTTFSATAPITTQLISIPTTAYNGPTTMRVRLVYFSPISPCQTSTWGETEDYGVTINGGVTNTNPPFTYNWSNNLSSTLVSPNSNGTFANNILAPELYKVTVTSSEGCIVRDSIYVNVFTANLIDSVNATPSNVCPGGSSVLTTYSSDTAAMYCSADNLNNNCVNGEFIQQVSLGAINHITGCDSIGYKDYSNISTGLTAGQTYTISLTDGYYYLGDQWGVWIDYNQNGILEDGMEFTSFTASSAFTTGTITVPPNAFNGPTKMRVRLIFAAGIVPCGTSIWGETEDYTVVINGGINPPPYLSLSWSNNVNSQLSATSGSSVTASTITANEMYYVTATKIDGCIETDSVAVDINCGSTLLLKLFLQGYYSGAGNMAPALYNQGVSASTTLTDTITVELHDSNFPHALIESRQAELNTDGTALCTFDSSGTYYIAVKHRNAIQTWSSIPVTLSSLTFYDFSNSIFQAYGNNMIEIDFGICAFYSGDVTLDENIDLLDLGVIEGDINNFVFGYFPTDLNGDGNVDLLDTPVLETNVNNFIFSNHP